MTSSATSRLRLDFHHIKVDFKKLEVVQPLVHAQGVLCLLIAVAQLVEHGVSNGKVMGSVPKNIYIFIAL